MGSTSSYLTVHFVFSTKDRRPHIRPEIQEKLWAYMAGIARRKNMHALCIGGMPDHVHMLLKLPTTLSASKAMQLIKANSSAWFRQNYPAATSFGWQDGYGAFSVCASRI